MKRLVSVLDVPTEASEGTSLMKWAHAIRHKGLRLSDYLLHIPNGAYFGKDRRTAAIVMRKLREQGLRKGCSDYLLAIPVPCYAGLWLELKRMNASPSDTSAEQLEFQKHMEEVGYRAKVVKGWAEGAKAIKTYLGIQ